MRILKYFAVVLLVSSWDESANLSAAEPAEMTFRETVGPFLAKHCVKCHGPDLAEGKVRLDAVKPEGAATTDRTLWLAALKQLSLGTMPPAEEPRPQREALENVIHWLRQALKLPDGVTDVAELPGLGNYVDHKLLFTEPDVRKADAGQHGDRLSQRWRGDAP